jgi:hypothetical protein
MVASHETALRPNSGQFFLPACPFGSGNKRLPSKLMNVDQFEDQGNHHGSSKVVFPH